MRALLLAWFFTAEIVAGSARTAAIYGPFVSITDCALEIGRVTTRAGIRITSWCAWWEER